MSGVRSALMRVCTLAGLGLIWITGDAGAGVDRWDFTPLEGGTIEALAIDPGNPNLVLAGMSAGIFRSEDGGTTWEKGEFDGYITDLAFGSDGNVYMAESGVRRSADGGATWQEFQNEIRYRGVNDLELVPGNPDVLYVGTWEGVYRSTDRGQTWSYTGDDGLYRNDITAIVVDPEDPNTLIVGTGGGIFRSQDGGASWAEANGGLENWNVQCLTIAPNDAGENVVWAGTGAGVYRSGDTGATWSPSGLQGKGVLALLWHETGMLYAGTGRSSGAETLWGSADAGDSWSPLNESDLPDKSVNALVYSDHLYAGTTATGVFQYLEGWTPTNDGLYAVEASAMAATPFDPVVFMGTGAGVLYYDRATKTVAPLHEGMGHKPISDLAWGDYGDDTGVLYASSSVVGVFKLPLPLGESPVWVPAAGSGELPGNIVDLGMFAGAPNDVFAASGDGVYQSADGGASWWRVGYDFSGGPSQVECGFDQGTSELIVYVGTWEGRIYRSIDGGGRWNERGRNWGGNVNGIVVDPGDPNIVYVGADDRVWRTDDGGNSWQDLSNRGELQWGGIGPDVAFDPMNPREIYVRQHGQVFQSFDRGDYWEQIPNSNDQIGWPEWSWIRGIAFAPGSNFIFASSPGWIGEIELSDRGPVLVERGHWRSAIFPNEPMDIYAVASGGDAELAFVRAELRYQQETPLLATVELNDSGILPDDSAGDGLFSGRWAGSDRLGGHSINLVAEDVDGRQTRVDKPMGPIVAHTILSIPDYMLISPEQLASSKVPVLIEDDGTGYLSALGFLSAEFRVHVWANGNGLDPVSVGVDFTGALLGGLDGLADTGTESWYDGWKQWNVYGALANASPLSLGGGPDPSQAVLAYLPLEVEAPDNRSIGFSVDHAMFGEGKEGVATVCCGHVELGRGDVNLDHSINSFDASLVLMHTVRKLDLNQGYNWENDWIENENGFTFPDFTYYMADVSGGWGITALDAAYILQRTAGMIDHFPAEEGYYLLWNPPTEWWDPPTEPAAAKPVANALPRLRRVVSLGNAEMTDAGLLAVPVEIDEMDGVLAGSFALGYDAARLEPVGARLAELTEGYLLADHAADGVVRVGFAGAESRGGSGAVAEVLFRKRDADSGELGEVELSEVRLNEEDVEVRVESMRLALVRPEAPVLLANFPNPFNPSTMIRFELPEDGVVRLSVYNLTGQRVRGLVDGHGKAGVHRVLWDGRDEGGNAVASGVYLYRLETERGILVRKMLMVK